MFPKMVATLLSRTFISKTLSKLNTSTASRCFCVNTSIVSESNEELISNFDQLCTTDKQIVKVLATHKFTVSDINSILKHVEKRREKLPNLNAKLVNESIMYWGLKLKTDFKEDELGISTDMRHVLANVEPDLLFVCQPEMNKRIDNVMKIGILSGKNDFLKVFKGAPRGYLLQEWSQIMKKFYYFQYVIMEWWLKGNKDKYPTPHPLIKHPKIIECNYEHIKARFLFAVHTGLKSPTVLASLKQKSVDFRTLLLDDVESYLNRVAPYCTPEEYTVFEDMITEMDDEEDKIIEELSELGVDAAPRKLPSEMENPKPKFKRRKRRA